MKNIPFLIIGLSLLFFSNNASCSAIGENGSGVKPATGAQNTLNIMCSPELYTLSTNWAAEYRKIYPEIKIAINIAGENQVIAGNNLGFFSDETSATLNNESIWKMVIGRDAIVPVVNAKNPLMNELNRKGITNAAFAKLITDPQNRQWGALIENGQNVPVHFYILNNDAVIKSVQKFTGVIEEGAINNIALSANELISAIQNDIYAIGFCRLTDVRKATSNELIDNIQLLPIDKNGNGRMDNFEKIYGNLNNFTRGVWLGKYPHTLQSGIYVTASTIPTDKNEMAFLTWVLNEGQQYLNINGYTELSSNESESNISALIGSDLVLVQPEESSAARYWFPVLMAVLFTLVVISLAFRMLRKKKPAYSDANIHITSVLNENTIEAPGGLYFDKTHTWAFMEKDGIVRVGIDDFLQHITGKLTGIRMKSAGERISKGEKIITVVRDGKQLNIYAPVSGKIMEQNQALISDPSKINSSPYADGWVYKIEPKNWLREIQFLFMAEKYKEWLSDEFTRLKDFFAASVKTNSTVYAHIILQDGGELTDNVLADMEPEVWEDFQTNFINTSL